MKISDRLGHLTYSTLVHPGDTWAEMRESVATHVPGGEDSACRRTRRWACRCACPALRSTSLTRTTRPSARTSLDYLRAEDLYVYTINAFPHGPFKGRVGHGAGLRARLDHRGPHPTTRWTSPTSSSTSPSPASSRPSRPLRWPSGPTSPGPAYVDRLHHQPAARRRAPDRPGATHRPPDQAGARARAVLLPGDDRGDRPLLRGARLLARRRRGSWPSSPGCPVSEAHRPGPPPPRDRVRHRPPVGRVRGHRRVARARSSPPASRSSSSRRPRRCGSRR